MAPQKIDALASRKQQDDDQHHDPTIGRSTLGGSASSRFNKRTLLLITVVGVIGLGTTVVYTSWWQASSEQPEQTDQTKEIKNHLPPLYIAPPAPDPMPAPPPPTLVAPTKADPIDRPRPRVSRTIKQPPSPAELLRQRRLAAPLSEGSSGQSHSPSPPSPTPVTATTQDQGQSTSDLQDKIKPLRLNPSQAGVLSDRNYLLTQGAMIDCVLETRMITTQPGMTVCHVTRDLYSANGHVILIDRGSKVVGHYQGGLHQGQARIFVLWTRIETPHGVIINLDSPGTGSLGEGGVGGEIDTHFWERFGGAILLSLIDDLAQGGLDALNKRKGDKNSQITFSNTTGAAQDMASEALNNSINIPPTLYKNQGDRISIFVARDLDFRGVYDLNID